MSNTTAPRYGYDPQVPFAATRAYAARRARETAAATARDGHRPRPARHPIRALVTRLVSAWS